MNSMHALKFFLEIICGVALCADVAVWVMLYFLRRKVHQRRDLRAARVAQETASRNQMEHVELVPH
jgi:hypothetical protein